MFKMLEVLTYIDEFVTNKLTDFCWWIDFKFDKNNLWLSRKAFIWFFTLKQRELVRDENTFF